MPELTAKRKFFAMVAISVLAIIFVVGIYPKLTFLKPEAVKVSENPSQNDLPKIISTKPDPLDEAVVSATEEIEVTFNRPLQNSAELKLRMEPEMDYKVELSGDRKTAKIIPNKPYPLGTTFTLFIGPETKFDGVGKWGEEKVFHFRTIKYTGV